MRSHGAIYLGIQTIKAEVSAWSLWAQISFLTGPSAAGVCNPRKHAPLKQGSKSDRGDARNLTELLRLDSLKPGYHAEHGIRTPRDLARSCLTITRDFTRVTNRLKPILQLGHPLSGKQVYAPRHRSEGPKITEASVRRRTEYYYAQLVSCNRGS